MDRWIIFCRHQRSFMECGIKLHDVKGPVLSLPNQRKIQNVILVAWIYFFRRAPPPGRLLLFAGSILPFKNKSPCIALSALPLLGKRWGLYLRGERVRNDSDPRID